MALQDINIGAAPNDKTGTPARQAGQMINQNFHYLDDKIVTIQNPDAVLKKGDIETDGLDVHVDADAFEWRIAQVDFTDNPEFDAVLDAATVGYYRKDLLLGDNEGGYHIFKGDEDPVSASEPNLIPNGTIKLGVIDVYGGTIAGTEPIDLSGYATKDELALEAQNRAYADDDINVSISNIENSITDLEENKADLTYVNSKLSSVLKYKGSVANYAALPSTGMEVGDVYNLTDTGHNYAWSGTVWDDLGPAVDISGKEDTTNKTSIITGNESSTTLYSTIKGIVDYFTSSRIKTILGISTLSGSNTGDETTSTLKTKIDEFLSFALSDETSNLTVGTLISFRMPFAMTLTDVRISVNDAPTVSSLIVDVKEAGVSIFSTLLSIDATELTSVTAATPAVISDVNLADDALITISTTQVGSGNTGKGLKLTLKGKKA